MTRDRERRLADRRGGIFDGPHADRVRAATDGIGRGTYLGEERRSTERRGTIEAEEVSGNETDAQGREGDLA